MAFNHPHCAEVWMHPQAMAQSVPSLPLAMMPTERKSRVLLVEDDADMRRLVAAVLSHDGHDVVQEVDGVAMLRRIEAGFYGERPDYFDLIVADIQLPDITALEVLGLAGRGLASPIILMTAYGDEQARAEACLLGVVALLKKPLDWNKLRRAVRTALGLR